MICRSSFRSFSTRKLVVKKDVYTPALDDFGIIQELGNLCGLEQYFISKRFGLANIVVRPMLSPLISIVGLNAGAFIEMTGM